jgi:prepilin-type N-terminal cleavage/methylation domain-containing protein
MTFSKLKTMKKDRGFTIVELLIVIVVIAILAAIVIVAYNGVQNRAKASAALSSAQAVISKSEAMNAETGAYPVHLADMTASGVSSTSYYLTGITVSGASDPGSSSATNVVSFATCVTPSGIRVGYYDPTTPGVKYLYAGGATSSSTCTNSTT